MRKKTVLRLGIFTLLAALAIGSALIAPRIAESQQPPAAAQTGSLDIRTTPTGATIFVDSKEEGTTNKVVTLPVGSHEVKLVKEGYVELVFKVEVKANKKLPVKKTLALKTADLQVNVNTAGASVFIDGALKGKTVAGKALVIKAVKAGERKLKVTHPKFETYEGTVNVQFKQPNAVEITLKPKGQPAPPSTEPATPPPANPWANSKQTFVGTDKCKICHKDQYNVWINTKHAKAFSALKPEEQKKKECVVCHTTPAEQAVGCEACHGPGSDYKSPNIMNKARFAADHAAQEKLAIAAGLVPRPTAEICMSCHNKNSPQFKGFDFAAYKEKIKHWK